VLRTIAKGARADVANIGKSCAANVERHAHAQVSRAAQKLCVDKIAQPAQKQAGREAQSDDIAGGDCADALRLVNADWLQNQPKRAPWNDIQLPR